MTKPKAYNERSRLEAKGMLLHGDIQGAIDLYKKVLEDINGFASQGIPANLAEIIEITLDISECYCSLGNGLEAKEYAQKAIDELKSKAEQVASAQNQLSSLEEEIKVLRDDRSDALLGRAYRLLAGACIETDELIEATVSIAAASRKGEDCKLEKGLLRNERWTGCQAIRSATKYYLHSSFQLDAGILVTTNAGAPLYDLSRFVKALIPEGATASVCQFCFALSGNCTKECPVIKETLLSLERFDVTDTAKRSGLPEILLVLVIRAIALTDRLSAIRGVLQEGNVFSQDSVRARVDNDPFGIAASEIATLVPCDVQWAKGFIRRVWEKSLMLPVPSESEHYVFAFSRDLSQRVRHSCAPDSLVELGLYGQLLITRTTKPQQPVPITPQRTAKIDIRDSMTVRPPVAIPSNYTVNFAIDPSLMYRPVIKRAKYLRSRFGLERCTCTRCDAELNSGLEEMRQQESERRANDAAAARDKIELPMISMSDKLLSSVYCRVCEIGHCCPVSLEDWVCIACGIVSLRPGRISTEIVYEFEAASQEKDHLKARSQLVKVLEKAEIFFGRTHWVTFSAATLLVRSYSGGQCADHEKALQIAQELLLVVDDISDDIGSTITGQKKPEWFGSMRNMVLPYLMSYVILSVVSPRSAELALKNSPAARPFMFSTAILPIIQIPKGLVLGSQLRTFSEESRSSVARKILPLACEFWRVQLTSNGTDIFSGCVLQAVVVKALSDAAACGDVETIKSLSETHRQVLKYSLDRIAIDQDIPILAVAVRARQLNVVRILVREHNANPLFANSRGWSALHESISNNSIDTLNFDAEVTHSSIVKALIKCTEQERIIQARLPDGRTLLHLCNDPRIGKLLLEEGLDCRTTDKSGKSAIDISRSLDNAALIELYQRSIPDNQNIQAV